MTATVEGPSGSAELVGSNTVTVPAYIGSIIGYLDVAGDGSELPALTPGRTLYARGAADSASGAPVQSVAVLVDTVTAMAAGPSGSALVGSKTITVVAGSV